MNVTLVRRWGAHPTGATVDVSESQARWLVEHDYAEGTGELQPRITHQAARVHPGADGPGPLAGGDPTRRRPRTQPR